MSKQTPKKYIKGSVIIALYLLFLLWTQSWLGLILLPILIDIYFTRFLPWGFWKNFSNPIIKTVFSWLDAIIFALIAVYFVNIFIFQNYQIPTSSLEKTLLVGDHLFVSKLSYGPRIPNTPIAVPITHNTMPNGKSKSYLETPHWDYKRIKGLGKVKRGDIVVFNYPSGDTVVSNAQEMDFYKLAYEIGYNLVGVPPQLDSLSIDQERTYFSQVYEEGKKVILGAPQFYGELITRPVDRRENYVKRCVGLPGDTLEIKKSKIYINNKLSENAPDVQYNYYVQTSGQPIPEKIFRELGINKDDRSWIRQDLYVRDRTQNNQLIYHQEGATKKEIDSAIQQYGSSNKYSVELSYQNLSKFLIKNGFDSKGLQGKSHFIYHLPLTQKMAEALATNTTLISHIIQEPIVKEQYDDSYQELLIYPLNKRTKWDKNEYGPLWIPKRGETIQLSLDNLPIYERCIRVYEGNTLEVRDNKIHINGKEATAYTFKLDYYWMMGDNRDNSLDSRYWGFVPEDHIVGKPLFVWLSLEKDYGWFDGHIRWSRFFKWIK